MNSPTPALAVTGLTAGYPAAGAHRRDRRTDAVLHDVTLALPPESFVAVLGPSGCGKTTLLRVVAGLLPAVSGRVEIAGALVTDGPRGVPPERRRIGLVPQEAALFPHLDVAANVAYGLRSRGARRMAPEARAERVAAMLDLVELRGLAHRRPHELSGGQRQRVSLARALAPEPALVLLDEPFAALDAALRTELRTQVKEILRRSRTTAVLVTHDQDEALSLADRVALLREGRLLQDAPPATLYQRPADAWAASFVGDAVALPATSDGAIARCELGTFGTSLPAGEVLAVLRPEQLELAPRIEGTDANGVSGTVTDVEYFGHDSCYRVRLEGSGTMVLARAAGPRLLSAGTPVAVSVRGTAMTFPPDA
ncbi:ABC transporter ATP-binding protein [Pseudactinotalea sp.]|uniref:ABC transporter ATP-binding protein n=1 Tax=Pseudactinotalea sp. TaxID=1926260 RepID=UPI003B3A421C